MLRRLYSRIIMVKVHRNFRRPINRLPREVLSAVFQVVVYDWSLSIQASEGRSLSYSWATMTHVCNHWRNVALETTTLWTHIIVHKQRLIETLLQRSRSSGLFIYYWEDPFPRHERSQSRILNLIRPHFSRVEHIHIGFTSPDYTPTTFVKLLLHDNLLPIQSLSFRSSSSSKNIGEELDEWTMLRKYHPAILRIEGTPANITTLVSAENLQHLSMVNSIYNEWKTFLFVLRKAPRLKSLICVDSMDHRSFDLSRCNVASLPCLCYAKLSLGTLQVLSEVLQHISYPITATLQLACNDLPYIPPAATITEMIDRNFDLRTYLRKLIPKNLHLLTIHASTSMGWHDLTIESRNFKLHIAKICTPREQSDIINGIAFSLITGALRCLTFGPGIDNLLHRDWERIEVYHAIRGNAFKLQQLAVPSMYHLTSLLTPEMVSEKDTIVRNIPFPELKTLHIGTLKHNYDAMTLYDILQIRKKGGSVLHDIYMPHDPDPGIYDPLAELVRRVHI